MSVKCHWRVLTFFLLLFSCIDNDPKYLSLPGSNIRAAELPTPIHLVKFQFHLMHSVYWVVCCEAEVVNMFQGHWVGAVSYPHCGRQCSPEAHSRWHFGTDRTRTEWRNNRPQLAEKPAGNAFRSAGTWLTVFEKLPLDFVNAYDFYLPSECFSRFIEIPLRRGFWSRPIASTQQRDSSWCRREMWVRTTLIDLL